MLLKYSEDSVVVVGSGTFSNPRLFLCCAHDCRTTRSSLTVIMYTKYKVPNSCFLFRNLQQISLACVLAKIMSRHFPLSPTPTRVQPAVLTMYDSISPACFIPTLAPGYFVTSLYSDCKESCHCIHCCSKLEKILWAIVI